MYLNILSNVAFLSMYLYYDLNVPALVGAKLVDYECECLDTEMLFFDH